MWALGCVILAFWLPLAIGREFMQPGAHLLVEPCNVDLIYDLYTQALGLLTLSVDNPRFMKHRSQPTAER